jgi:hypothetical protein
MRATEEAVSSVGKRVEANQIGALDISKKSMHFAEHNVLSAFEFTDGVIRAKDIQELIWMQTKFIQSQMQVLSEQVRRAKRAGARTWARPLARLQRTA